MSSSRPQKKTASERPVQKTNTGTQSSHSGMKTVPDLSIDHDSDPKRGIYNSIEIDYVMSKKGQSMEFERNLGGFGTYGDNNSTHYTIEPTADLQRRTATLSRSGMNSSLTHEHKVQHSVNMDSGMLIESSLTNNYGTNPPLPINQYSSTVHKRKEPPKYTSNETMESFKRPSKEPKKTVYEERKFPQEENVRTNQKTFVSKNNSGTTNQTRMHQNQPNSYIEQSGSYYYCYFLNY